MSYDLRLYRKNQSQEPLKKEELEPLKFKFNVSITAFDERGNVEGFEITPRNGQSGNISEFYRQDDGSYWASISYGMSAQEFVTFKKVVKDVASMLSLQIQDPQLNNELFDPENYDVGDRESTKRFNYVSNVFLPKIPHMIPAKSKYFILYFIKSKNPATSKDVILTLGNNRTYASKVNIGETLLGVVNREIIELTGSSKYKLLKVVDKYDTAFDRHGNKLPRSAIYLEVPYFDPKTKSLRYPVEWVESGSPKQSASQTPRSESNMKLLPIKNHDERQLRQYEQNYREAKSILGQKFPQHYIASLKIYKDKNLKYVTMSTWADFIPTIFPESDYVMLVLFDSDEQKPIDYAKSYIIKQKKLFFLLNKKIEKIYEPITCFSVNQLNDLVLRQKILDQAKFIKEVLVDRSN